MINVKEQVYNNSRRPHKFILKVQSHVINKIRGYVWWTIWLRGQSQVRDKITITLNNT